MILLTIKAGKKSETRKFEDIRECWRYVNSREPNTLCIPIFKNDLVSEGRIYHVEYREDEL